MEKRWIVGLLVAISIALAGLIAIQVKWMRSTLRLKEAQFEMSVNNALYAVSDRLEQLERFRELQRHEVGERLMLRLDTLRRANAEAMRHHRQRAIALTEAHPPEPPVEPVAPDAPQGHEEFMAWEEEERILGADETDWIEKEDVEEGAEIQEALVMDLVRNILANELQHSISERVDPALLDSLLRAELLANDIDGGWSSAIFNAAGEPVLVPAQEEASLDVLRESPYRERLFRHDMVGETYFLHLYLPERQGMLLGNMIPMIIISVLFIAVIVLAFILTMRTIFRQKRISDIRTDLVNNLTHELKTPISTIGLACEALSDPSMPKTEQQVKTFVGMIRDENKRLGSLVENVLQSAVMDGGHMVIKPVDLDMHGLVHDVVRSSEIQVSRRNGMIELDLQAEIHHVQGDRIHLSNLLYNLVDNAVKYSEQGPRIRISTRSDDVGMTISVSDNGIGIPASEQSKIFDRLYRVPTGNIHNAKGFGLGLSYVRTVVQRHQGRIKVESAHGRGSTFHIFIPFEHVQTHQATAG